MENQPTQQPPLLDRGNMQQNQWNQQVPLPNASVILILGIVSIALCWCYGIIGLLCSIIALVLAKSAQNTYDANPSAYTSASYSNMKAGRICSYIGLAISVIYLLIIVFFVITVGTAIFTDPQAIQEYLQQMQ